MSSIFARPSVLGRGWATSVIAVVCIVVGVLVPLLNVVPGESSALHVPDFFVALMGKLTCYAIVAIAMDLVWGYAGILKIGRAHV